MIKMLPNCLVIGAPRSGTTSLYEYMDAHPEIYMSPVKEPDFFANPILDEVCIAEKIGSGDITLEEMVRLHKTLNDEKEKYEALFAGAGSAKRRGECSAIYLGHPTAPSHIRKHIPNVKMVAVLRNPSERIHSHYVHASRIHGDFADGESGKQAYNTFRNTVELAYQDGYCDPAMTDPEVWVRSGFYFRNLSHYYALFPKDQLRVYLFEDLVTDPGKLMKDVFEHLEVDSSFVLPTTAAFNASVVPRNTGLFRFFTTRNPLMRVARSLAPAGLRAAAMKTRNRILTDNKPALEPELRHKLICIYREDILQLQDMLQRDLSAWLAE